MLIAPNVMNAERPRRHRFEAEILQFFDIEPEASTQQAARMFGVSQWYLHLYLSSASLTYHFIYLLY